ncbi:hypothetical protein GGI43DRAFT_389417 [Trichoderma evansii]
MANSLSTSAAGNCTVQPISSDEAVGWQPGGCYRGTWDIVSTCLFTIFACTWSIQHLNIPAKDDVWWVKTRRKTKWMIITVLFPELVLIHAMLEFHMAWTALRLIGKSGKSVESPWWSRKPTLSWLPHCGQHSKAKGQESQNVTDPESQDGAGESRKTKWTLAHCYFANMGGFVYKNGEKPLLVGAQRLAEAEDLLYTNSGTTEEDIKDKSKQDWLAKLLAALQISQLILSIITRHIQGVQFSQLETVTLSFAICGVLIYWAYFYKPQNIEMAIELNINAPVSNDALQKGANSTQEAVAWFSLLQSEKTYDSLWAIMLNKHTGSKETDSSKCQKTPRIPNDNIPINKGDNDVHPAVYLLALSSGLFGAIHAIAWQFEFPTDAEKLLWQIATCISAASPVIGLFAIPFAQFTKSTGDPELFAGNCLRLMQEYSWHASDTSRITDTIKELEDAIAKGERKKYSEIFHKTGDNTLIINLRDFLDLEGKFVGLRTRPFELHDDQRFVQNFLRLVDSVNGKETKKIEEATRIGVWPRQSMLPRGVNQGILYATGFLYCASRLILLAVSISSIRKMPGSVYIATDWTEYIPTFGAMGG